MRASWFIRSWWRDASPRRRVLRVGILGIVLALGVSGLGSFAYAAISGTVYTSSWARMATLATYANDYATGTTPAAVAFDGTNVWVANYGSNSVTKLSGAGVVLATYALASNASPVAIAFDGTSMWTANSGNDTLSRIGPTGVVTQAAITLPTGSGPQALALGWSGYLYVANFTSGTITAVSTQTPSILNTTSLGGPKPVGIAYDGMYGIWTANSNSTLTSMSTLSRAITRTVSLPSRPQAIAFDGISMWTANPEGNSVSRVSLTGTVSTFPITGGQGPLAIAFDQPGYSTSVSDIDPRTYLWTSNSNKTITKIDATTGTVVNSYPVSTSSTRGGLCFDGTNLWVAQSSGDSVARIRVR